MEEHAADLSLVGAIGVLQWGHVDEAVEEKVFGANKRRAELLQWGHVDEAVEEERVFDAMKNVIVPSMGPRR